MTLAELSRLAETLNKETDSYTESLAELERKLCGLNLGVDAWVPLSEDERIGNPGRESSMQTFLGYAKVADKWGFAIKQVRVERGYFEGDSSCPWENHYDEGEPKLLLKSSRELRFQAASRIKYLMDALLASGNECLSSIKEAKKFAEQL